MRFYVAAIMAVLAVSLVGAGAVAGPGELGMNDRPEMPGSGRSGSGQLTEIMGDRLGLDDVQRQSVQNIHDAAKPEMDALRESMKANRTSMRALDANDPNRSSLLNQIALEKGQLVADGILLSDRVRGEVDAVLTDEQREKLAKARSNMDQRRDGHKPRNRQQGKHGRDRSEESVDQ